MGAGSDGSFEGTVTLVMPIGWQAVNEMAKFHLVFNLLLSPKVREAVQRKVQQQLGLELVEFEHSHADGPSGGIMQKCTYQERGGTRSEVHHTYVQIAPRADDPAHTRVMKWWTSVDRNAGGSSGSKTYTAEMLKGSGWIEQEQEVSLKSEDDGNICASFLWSPPLRGDRFPGTEREFQQMLPKMRLGQQEAMGSIQTMFVAWALSRTDAPPKLAKDSTWHTVRNVPTGGLGSPRGGKGGPYPTRIQMDDSTHGGKRISPKKPDASTPVQSFTPTRDSHDSS